MADPTITLKIAGSDVDPADLGLSGEIVLEDSVAEAHAASLTADVEAGQDGEWTSALDPLVSPLAPVVVRLELEGDAYVFDGFAVEASWKITTIGQPTLVARAVDRSAEMDLEEKVVAWPGASDSTIAQSILSQYGMAADVEETPAGLDPDVHTVIQRGTDWAFLRSLAERWGYRAYLDADGTAVTGRFRSLDTGAEPQATLSLGFGGDSDDVDVRVDLVGGREVTAAAIPVLSDGEQTATSSLPDTPMGATPLGAVGVALLAPGDVPGVIEPDGGARAQARAASFVARLTATIDPDLGVLLRAGRTVQVGGLGSRLSGRWLVERVRHTITTSAHTQHIELVRDALDDDGGGGLLGGLL